MRLLAFYEHLVSRVCLFHLIVLHQYHFQSTPRLFDSLYTAYSKLFSSSFSPLSLSFASQYLWVMMRLKRGLRSKTSRSAREAELARRSRTGATKWYWPAQADWLLSPSLGFLTSILIPLAYDQRPRDFIWPSFKRRPPSLGDLL